MYSVLSAKIHIYNANLTCIKELGVKKWIDL